MSWCSHPEAQAIVARVRAIEGLPPAVVQDLRRLAWLVGGDTGGSSMAIFDHMTGAESRCSWGYEPLDGGDLGRCIRLLEAFPEWRGRIGEMAAHGPYWTALAAAWDGLERLSAGGWDSAVYRWMHAMRGPDWEWDGPTKWNRCRDCAEVLEEGQESDLHECAEDES